MVKIKLEDNFSNIIGLKKGERPLHLLEDEDKIFYLITEWDYSSEKPENAPAESIFVGNENEEMASVGKVIKIVTYRDGGTTEIEFIKDSEKGEIYVPSSFKKGLPSTLTFKGERKELTKVGYTGPFFSAWKKYQ